MVDLREIPGVVGYAAGSDGNIYSFRTSSNNGKGLSETPKRIRGHEGRNGYFYVALHAQRRRNTTVHRLVCSAFHGPCPEGMECSHLNGDRSDNRPENLKWETRAENNRRKTLHGTQPTGEDNTQSKLTWGSVEEARSRRSRGEQIRPLAKEFGVSYATMHSCLTGKTWRTSEFGGE